MHASRLWIQLVEQIFSQEAFTWRELSKTDSHFIVKFYGADVSDSDTHLRLISRQMEHGSIKEFLNLDMNKNEFIRYRTVCAGTIIFPTGCLTIIWIQIHGVVRAVKWLHSKHFVHADIKGVRDDSSRLCVLSGFMLHRTMFLSTTREFPSWGISESPGSFLKPLKRLMWTPNPTMDPVRPTVFHLGNVSEFPFPLFDSLTVMQF